MLKARHQGLPKVISLVVKLWWNKEAEIGDQNFFLTPEELNNTPVHQKNTTSPVVPPVPQAAEQTDQTKKPSDLFLSSLHNPFMFSPLENLFVALLFPWIEQQQVVKKELASQPIGAG